MGPVKAGRPSEPVRADALALTMMNGPDGLALYSHGRRAGSIRVLLNVTVSGTMRRSCDSSHCAMLTRSVSLTFEVPPLFHTPPESSTASMSESTVRLFCMAVNCGGRRSWSPIVISTSSKESLPLSDLTRFALMTTCVKGSVMLRSVDASMSAAESAYRVSPSVRTVSWPSVDRCTAIGSARNSGLRVDTEPS